MKKRIFILFLCAALSVSLLSCSSDTDQEQDTLDDPFQEIQSDPSDSSSVDIPSEEPTDGELEEPPIPEYVFEPGELAYLNKSRNELLEIYNSLDNLLLETDTSSFSTEEQRAFEEECTKTIASEYGLTEEDINNIYINGSIPNYFATFDVNNVSLMYGELQSVAVWGSKIVIKAKISPQMSNKLTVSQNYFSVCDFIRNYAGNDYTYISYWAVADMTDGSEQKVVSFDLSDDIIQTIATKDFPDNTLGDYADDLFIHPSLK